MASCAYSIVAGIISHCSIPHHMKLATRHDTPCHLTTSSRPTRNIKRTHHCNKFNAPHSTVYQIQHPTFSLSLAILVDPLPNPVALTAGGRDVALLAQACLRGCCEHARLPPGGTLVHKGRRVVLLEGTLLFASPSILQLVDKWIVLSGPLDACARRRQLRVYDGNPDPPAYFVHHSWPSHRQYRDAWLADASIDSAAVLQPPEHLTTTATMEMCWEFLASAPI